MPPRMSSPGSPSWPRPTPKLSKSNAIRWPLRRAGLSHSTHASCSASQLPPNHHSTNLSIITQLQQKANQHGLPDDPAADRTQTTRNFMDDRDDAVRTRLRNEQRPHQGTTRQGQAID